MSRLILACDPGVSGAFALLTAAGEYVHVSDMPISINNTTKWVDADTLLSSLLRLLEGRECTAIVERVHAMPKNGCVAAFSQGMTLGSLLAGLQVARVRIEFVAPGVWKRQIGLVHPKETPDPQRKEAARQLARQLFPAACEELERKKDHNRGEALLLAHWYLSKHGARTTQAVPEAMLQAGQGTLI